MDSTTTTSPETTYVKVHDTYFRRFLVPVTITVLVLAIVVVIIMDTAADGWGANGVGNSNMNLFGGAAATAVARNLFPRRR